MGGVAERIAVAMEKVLFRVAVWGDMTTMIITQHK